MPFDNTDFSSQLDTMLAPYQSAVQKLQQPYPMLGGQGGHFALQHPLLAGGLNDAMMNVAFTPGPQGPEGVGGGISRALQGVLGASQYKRQQAMMSAMLPYQMLQPRLQAEDTLAQIADRRSEVPYRRAMEERAMAQSDYYTKRADAMDKAKAVTGDKRIDDSGNIWHGIMDPEKGYRYQNPITQKYADELPADQQPSFKNEEKVISASRLNEDYTPSGILRRRAHGDPSAAVDQQRYEAMQGTVAGSRAGATKTADQPFVDEAAMIAREKGTKYDDLVNPKNTKMEEYSGYPGMQDLPDVRAYNLKKQEYQRQVVSRDQEFEHYASSTAPSQGVTRAEYAANKEKYPPKNKSRADLPSGDTRPTTTNSGSTWTPNKN